MTRAFAHAAFAAALLFPVAAMAQATVPVSIRFAAEINGQAFACGQTYSDVGTPKADITPTDYRFYVTGLELLDAEGKATPVTMTDRALWQAKGIALLDFENGNATCEGGNPGLNDIVEGTAPAGNYTGLRFTLGMPFEEAHGDMTIASAPLDVSAMFWSWRLGYRYLKVDMTGDMRGGHGNRPTGFSVHLGDTGCEGASSSQRPTGCAQVNTVPVTLAPFDIDQNVVVADLGRLLATTDTRSNAPDTAPGCMSGADDADCAGLFAVLGLPFAGAPATTQTFFESR